MADGTVTLDGVSWRPRTGPFALGPLTGRMEAGSFVALVGPNGAGKTTILNLLSGLLTASAGSICYFGTGLSHRRPRERGRCMAYLSQEPEKPFGFTVREYVSLGRFPHLGPFRSMGRDDVQVVECEIRAWGLEELADRSVSTLSGGEFQRVRLARALVQEPRILLLDEPGNHLDLNSRFSILGRLRKESDSGRCVVAVLHDINDALLYATDVWLISGGRIVREGDPEDILNPDLLKRVFGVELSVFNHPEGSTMLGVLGTSKSSPD